MKKTKQIREKERVLTKDVSFDAHELYTLEANRQLSSKWTVLIQVKINMQLPDGRILIVDEQRALPARQVGRRKIAPQDAKKKSSQEKEIINGRKVYK